MTDYNLGDAVLHINGEQYDVKNVTICRGDFYLPPDGPPVRLIEVRHSLSMQVRLARIDLAALELFLGLRSLWDYSPAAVVESLEKWMDTNGLYPRAGLIGAKR